MNLLLDTHVALWAITDDRRLSEPARRAIEAARTVSVSVASLWEIALKHALNRGDMPVDSTEAEGYFRVAGYEVLPIDARHVHALAALPALHRDPFDRLLVAQATAEELTLVTNDRLVARYDERILAI